MSGNQVQSTQEANSMDTDNILGQNSDAYMAGDPNLKKRRNPSNSNNTNNPDDFVTRDFLIKMFDRQSEHITNMMDKQDNKLKQLLAPIGA